MYKILLISMMMIFASRCDDRFKYIDSSEIADIAEDYGIDSALTQLKMGSSMIPIFKIDTVVTERLLETTKKADFSAETEMFLVYHAIHTNDTTYLVDYVRRKILKKHTFNPSDSFYRMSLSFAIGNLANMFLFLQKNSIEYSTEPVSYIDSLLRNKYTQYDIDTMSYRRTFYYRLLSENEVEYFDLVGKYEEIEDIDFEKEPAFAKLIEEYSGDRVTISVIFHDKAASIYFYENWGGRMGRGTGYLIELVAPNRLKLTSITDWIS